MGHDSPTIAGFPQNSGQLAPSRASPSNILPILIEPEEEVLNQGLLTSATGTVARKELTQLREHTEQ